MECIWTFLSHQYTQNILLIITIMVALFGNYLAYKAHKKTLAIDINFRAFQLRKEFISQFERDMSWLNSVGYPPFRILRYTIDENDKYYTATLDNNDYKITYDKASSLIRKALQLFPDSKCQNSLKDLHKILEIWKEIILNKAKNINVDECDFFAQQENYSDSLNKCLEFMNCNLDLRNFFHIEI